jgi:hypothetical protein
MARVAWQAIGHGDGLALTGSSAAVPAWSLRTGWDFNVKGNRAPWLLTFTA